MILPWNPPENLGTYLVQLDYDPGTPFLPKHKRNQRILSELCLIPELVIYFAPPRLYVRRQHPPSVQGSVEAFPPCVYLLSSYRSPENPQNIPSRSHIKFHPDQRIHNHQVAVRPTSIAAIHVYNKPQECNAL